MDAVSAESTRIRVAQQHLEVREASIYFHKNETLRTPRDLVASNGMVKP